MPLVEVVAGRQSAPWAVAAAVKLSRQLGKMPVVVGDCPGFLVNRLLMPYLNEAAYLAGEGVSIAEIDAAMSAFGWPMGPFMLLDMVGIDVGYKVAEVLAEHYGERMETAPLFSRIGEQTDLLGKKGGRGFYRYQGKKSSLNSEIDPHLKQVRREYGGASGYTREEIQRRLMLPMVFEAARALEEGIAESPEDIDIALVLGTGFPPFRGGLLKWVDSVGIETLVNQAEEFRHAESVSGRRAERFAAPELLSRKKEAGGFYRH
jgi:3-hydroxyacyl-CoA dehydrogenase/enoyl-CoA hydratase/3-hydroxybutyryl-CoA epimerase